MRSKKIILWKLNFEDKFSYPFFNYSRAERRQSEEEQNKVADDMLQILNRLHEVVMNSNKELTIHETLIKEADDKVYEADPGLNKSFRKIEKILEKR